MLLGTTDGAIKMSKELVYSCSAHRPLHFCNRLGELPLPVHHLRGTEGGILEFTIHALQAMRKLLVAHGRTLADACDELCAALGENEDGKKGKPLRCPREERVHPDTVKPLNIHFAHDQLALLEGWNNLLLQRAVAGADMHRGPLEHLAFSHERIELGIRQEPVEVIPFAGAPRARGGAAREDVFGMLCFERAQHHALSHTARADDEYKLAGNGARRSHGWFASYLTPALPDYAKNAILPRFVLSLPLPDKKSSEQ